MSSKEASWAVMVPLLVSWEVSPRGDLHPGEEEEEAVGVEPHLEVEAAVEAEAEEEVDIGKAAGG